MSVWVPDLAVSVASVEDAAGMVEVIHAAFGARPVLDPPSTADAETAASVAQSLRRGAGIYARVGGRPAGVILVLPGREGVATFSRVSVHPDFQRHGIASAMVLAAESLAARQGYQRVELLAREELAELVAFWLHRGFHHDHVVPHGMILTKPLPMMIKVPTSTAMRDLGARLARLLEPGDVIIASGELGAGKTTLTQGIGRGLGTTGQVISPTFVLSRIHPSATGRPGLVHVDAYRLSGPDELDDLDLDATVPDSVTVVEWGRGVAEGLAADRLEIDIWHPPVNVTGPGGSGGVPPGIDTAPTEPDSERIVIIRTVGSRWSNGRLTELSVNGHG
jgi:tRNA threonylcarbamoyladenosine biosynthesis protein TsaE